MANVSQNPFALYERGSRKTARTGSGRARRLSRIGTRATPPYSGGAMTQRRCEFCGIGFLAVVRALPAHRRPCLLAMVRLMIRTALR